MIISSRICIIVLTALLAAGLVGCGDDSDDSVKPGPSRYKDLTQKDHTLLNLEIACNDRNVVEYDRLLDDDFIFHFGLWDYNMGYVGVEWWDRAAEITVTAKMFDPSYSHPRVDPISSIDMSFYYQAGDTAWVEIAPRDTLQFPGEKWYKKNVRYDLLAKAGSMNYTALLIPMDVVIRSTSSQGKTVWRIVDLYDDTIQSSSVSENDLSDFSVPEDFTLGRLKWLFVE
ncbi:MAG: hypothetical protein JSW58_15140 [Candidatus Latescibacterota bacterium]|nr:MAG: hypothetical protein JSW58_15140 [Candidatus Latescibacterota bacterium]